jgi:hypothetical protein
MAMPDNPTTQRVDMNADSQTAAQSALGASSLSDLSGVLKDVYLPGITNTLFFDNKFTRLIKNEAGNIDASGRRIVKAFETQRGGGLGPMEEGGDFVKSRSIDGFQGWEWLKYCNMYVEFTGPAIATVQAGVGSYLDVVDSHMQSMAQAAQLDLERILMGCGDGRLAQLNVLPTADSATLTIKGPGFFDSQFIEDGMRIDVIAPVTTSATAYTIRHWNASSTASGLTINSHTTGNKRTSTKGSITIDQTLDIDVDDFADGDWIIRENAYGEVNNDGVSQCLEQNGLCNLVSDGLSDTVRGFSDDNGWLPTDESTENYTKIWNTGRSSYANQLRSISYNINDELDEENLLSVLIEAENQHQSDPNILIVTPRAVLKYFMNMRDDRRFNTMEAMDWTGGYTGLGIQLGDKKLMVTGLNSCPTGIGFLINTGDFSFVRPPGWSGYRWLQSSGGGILNQKEASDTRFATAVDYWQFVCNVPDRQIKLYNITE